MKKNMDSVGAVLIVSDLLLRTTKPHSQASEDMTFWALLGVSTATYLPQGLYSPTSEKDKPLIVCLILCYGSSLSDV